MPHMCTDIILYIQFHILFGSGFFFFFFSFSLCLIFFHRNQTHSLLKNTLDLLKALQYPNRALGCVLYNVYFSFSSGLNKSIYTVSSSLTLPPCRCGLHCYYIVSPVESSHPWRHRHFIHSFIFKTCFLFGGGR